jgi:UDP:flavonoid glycosyltransferase YjiC (YdhE family)
LATVLLGWELGGGFGHVRPLVWLARELAAHGHCPVLVLKQLAESAPLLRDLPFPVLQAPFWHPRPTGRPFLAASYADILGIRGFSDPDDLLALVRGWQSLIDVVRPDLLVSDHSPTLCLAAYGALPVIIVGNGFIVPPLEHPEFPTLVEGQPAFVPQSRILEVIREVQRCRSRPAPETLPGLLAGTARFVCTIPELDPYRTVRREPHAGPAQTLRPPPMPLPAHPRYFAYLGNEIPGLDQVLSALAMTGVSGSAYVRGARPEERARLAQPGLQILDAPQPMTEALAEVSVIIHHGSLGTAHDGLSAGRAHLSFPRHLEQRLTAEALASLGVGLVLSERAPPGDITAALSRLLFDPSFSDRAQRQATRLQAAGPWDALPRILERCLALL